MVPEFKGFQDWGKCNTFWPRVTCVDVYGPNLARQKKTVGRIQRHSELFRMTVGCRDGGGGVRPHPPGFGGYSGSADGARLRSLPVLIAPRVKRTRILVGVSGQGELDVLDV